MQHRSRIGFHVPDPPYSRFWLLPAEPRLRPHLLSRILDAFGQWSSYCCWAQSSFWFMKPKANEESDFLLNDQIARTILKGIGMPDGSGDMLEFSYSERAKLITLLLANTLFGFTQYDDLRLVPDNAQGIIETDHHGVIHASFEREATMLAFIEQMENEGYPLPDEPPDETFKMPNWMCHSHSRRGANAPSPDQNK